METIINGDTWKFRDDGTSTGFVGGANFVNVSYSKSLTGIAFYQTERVKSFDIPATNEIWLKFDVYFDGTNRWRAYNGGANDICGVCSYVGNSNYDFGIWQNGNKVQDLSGVCIANRLQTVLLHMVSGSTDGIIEAWVDGSLIYTYNGDVNNGQDLADIYLQSDGSGTLFSNVIISNSEIDLAEGHHRDTYDAEILIYNGLRGWRYFNPGYAELTASGGTTLNVGYSKSVTGKAFYGGNISDMFYTPSGLKEVWLRFDLYTTGGNVYINNGATFSGGFYSSIRNVIYGFRCSSGGDGRQYYDRIYMPDNKIIYLRIGVINHCLLHMVSHATNGLFEFTINEEKYSYSGNINGGDDFSSLHLRCTQSVLLFSNVIIAETETELAEGHHRDLFSVESQITAPVLNVRWQGSNHQFTLSTKKSKPAFAVHVGEKNFYTPIVNANDALASALRLYLDDSNKSVVQS